MSALPHVSEDFISESVGRIAGTQFRAVYRGNPPSRRLASSEHFAVLADLSPLMAGHVLLVTRANLPAMGAIRADLWAELLDLEVFTAQAITEAYGTCMLVEHGSSSDLVHSPCVSHAHWHLVPVAADLLTSLQRIDIPTQTISSPRELADWSASDQTYIFCRSSSGVMFVGSPDTGHPLPRQFVRREIAAHLRLADWDWGLPPDKDLLRATVAELGPRLAR